MHKHFYSIKKGSLLFRDRFYSGKDLISLMEKLSISAKQEEREVSLFLKEWFNDDPFIMVHTSGSTGTPKEIVLSKASMVQSAKRTIEYFQLSPKQTICLTLPAKYISGKMMMVRALIGQLNLILAPTSTKPFQNFSHTFDFTALVTSQLESFLTYADKFKTECKVLLGGGSIPTLLLEKIEKSETLFYQSYAMTETASHVALRKINENINKTPYTALPGISFGTKKDCLLIHSNYLDETTYETRDVVKLISPTEFYWLGRKDNIINSGGLKLNPEILEQKLEKFINKRFYIGKKQDDVLVEKIVLVIEEDKEKIDLSHLQFNMKQMLHKHEIPKEIIFRSSFPETPTGKIIREF